MRRILLLFVDGIGLGPRNDANPFVTVPMPALGDLLGGPLVEEQLGERGATRLLSVDACLGVEGLPQSATGQTALFTGRNAPRALGRHVTAFPGPRLQSLLAESSIFRRVREEGLDAAFANAFSQRYFELVATRRLRYSASVWAARAGGVRLRTLADLERGDAVSWDIVRDHVARDGSERVAAVSARVAGRHLAELAGRHRFTLYETFLTDLAGHGRYGLSAAEVLGRLDGLLAGLLEHLSAETTLVLTSDHGNLEEAGHTRHTRNPVPLLVHGEASSDFAGIESLLEVTPRILLALAGSDSSSRPQGAQSS